MDKNGVNNMTRFGVFAWHESPIYRQKEAVKIYKRESAAQNLADHYNNIRLDENYGAPRGWVVRDFEMEETI